MVGWIRLDQFELLFANLTDGTVVLFSMPRWFLSRQNHGKSKITDDTRAICLHQYIPTVQIPVRHGRFIHV